MTQSSDQPSASSGKLDLAAEIENFDEMAKISSKKAFIRDCRGDQTGAAFWRGRARGLELAAINLRQAALANPPLPARTTGEAQ